jgi:hypothetical protein
MTLDLQDLDRHPDIQSFSNLLMAVNTLSDSPYTDSMQSEVLQTLS